MKRLLQLVLMCVVLASPAAARNMQIGEKIKSGDELVRQTFLKGDLPFSFTLDGRHSDTFIKSWKRSLSKPVTDATGKACYTLSLTSPDKALRVRAEIAVFADFPAVEWTLYFDNLSDSNSGQLANLKTLDTGFSNKDNSALQLYTAQGCNAIDRDFHLLTEPLEVNKPLTFTPLGGRSSAVTAFPFFNVAAGNMKGVFMGIGWSGTWSASFDRQTSDALRISAGLPSADLYLYPGETIRTPLVSLLFWEGTDRIDGHNAWRRFVLAHHTPTKNGKPLKAPLCGGFDYGDPAPLNEYDGLTEKLAAAVVERAGRFGIQPEVYWLDAGWYEGCNAPYSSAEGRWWYNTVGSWVADPNRFPDGLKNISDMVHAAGAEFMVWFEPERVYEGSRWHREHPEWLLSYKDAQSYLFNLADAEACDFLGKYIGDFLEANGIDNYRQDFNINPDVFWAAADPEGRRGATEIHYVEGLYRFWDYLRDRFPGLMIDNCASGGLRIDLETISRAIPLWRTDCHYGEPTCQQCHTYGLSQFVPLNGTGIYYADKYCTRSGLSSAYSWFGEIFSRRNAVDDMRHAFKTYKELRDFFVADYYPLSGDGEMTGLDKWVGWQFNRPAEGDGIVQAFRRDEAADTERTYKLGGLDPEADYEVYNGDDNTTVVRSGRELMESGIAITLPEPRSSVLLRYSKAGGAAAE